MTLSSPALQDAYDKLMARRAGRTSGSTHYRPGTTNHPELKLAATADGTNRYFVVRYCTSCLRGTVIDLVQGSTDLPNAHELGIKRARPWRMECLNT